MIPHSSGHVRRNPNQPGNSQHYAGARMQSTPQAIPTAQSINPLHRAGTQRNFSPAQSPQHHVHSSYYHQTAVFPSGVNPNDMNLSHTSAMSQSPSQAKSHSNGQYMWQQGMAYPGQSHQSQVQGQNVYSGGSPMAQKFSRPPLSMPNQPYSNYPQNSGMIQPNNPMLFVPGSNTRQSRFPSQNTNPGITPSGQASMQAQSTSYYSGGASPQQYFSNPSMSQVPSQFGASYESSMQYPPPGQQSMSNPAMMQQQPPHLHMQMSHHQQQVPQASGQRKKVTIKDPHTMRDVTNDILNRNSGKRSDMDAGISQSPSTSSMMMTSPPEGIAVQFAAQVAAVANKNDRVSPSNLSQLLPAQSDGSQPSMKYPPLLQTTIKPGSPSNVSGLPSGVDTSIPPPSLCKNMPPPSIAISPGRGPYGMHPLAPYVHQSPNALSSSPKAVPQLNTTNPVVGSPPRYPPTTRSDAPVAVVEPLKNLQPPDVQSPPDDSDISKESLTNKLISVENKIMQMKQKIAAEVLAEQQSIKVTLSNISVDSSPQVEVAETPVLSSEKVVTGNDNDAIGNDRVQLDLQAPDNESPAAVISESTKSITSLVSDMTDESTGCEPNFTPAPSLVEKPSSTFTDGNLGAEDIGDVSDNAKAPTEKLSSALDGGDTAVSENADKFPLKLLQNEADVDINQAIQTSVVPVSTEVDPPTSSDAHIADEVLETACAAESEPAESKEELPSGKRVYDRDFLLQFRFYPVSLEKPVDLPTIDDITMERPLPKSSVSSALPSVGIYARDDFTPSWMRGGQRGGGRQSSRGSRSSQQRPGYGGGYGNQMGPPKVITKSIQKEPELNKAENAWKPSKLEGKSIGPNSTEEEQTEEVVRNVRSILNKLTPQKFTPLLQKFQQLPINTEGRLDAVINLIFEKAIDEPNFCEAYAKMCRTMSQFKVVVPSAAGGKPGAPVEFRKLLLTRCQREFEKDRSGETALSDLRKKMEEAKTPEEKQQMKEELEYAESKERRRIMGNIRFIGELFKLSMLTENIMHNCIMSLFRGRDDESLESLCRLLTTIGKDLDHAKGKARMDQYFDKINKIIDERKTSSRVRFMMKDVVDLRLNNWVPRAIKAQGPKTIDQIHQDAKVEKEQIALQQAAAAAAAAKSQSRGGRVGSRGSGHNAPDDGWTKVQQKPMRIDPQKMKLSKFDESNVTLGPSRGKLGWKSGSGSSTTRTGSGGYSNRDALDGITPRSLTPTIINRFSALGTTGGQDQRGYGRVSSQERTKTDSRGSTGSSTGTGRDERISALDTARRLTSNERKSAATSGLPPPKPVASVPNVKVNLDVILKKLKSIVEEYLHLHDIKEAKECFDELSLPPSYQHHIVEVCLEVSLERSSEDRKHTAKLLSFLVKENCILPKQYVEGVSSHLELALDLELDLPKIWSCLAEQLASIFHQSGEKIPLQSLKTMVLPLIEADKAYLFMVELLKKLILQLDLAAVIRLWNSSQLNIHVFMGKRKPDEVMEYLQRHKLECFYDSNVLSKFDNYLSSLTKLLDTNEKNETVGHWIDENILPDDRLEPVFVRALTTAVCNNAIKLGKSTVELDKDIFENRSILLKKYINDDTMELQALYALQKVYVDLEQPPNILKQLFHHLYEADIVTDQSFFKWEESDNSEEKGKGVALMSVKPFITWLRNDPDSDE